MHPSSEIASLGGYAYGLAPDTPEMDIVARLFKLYAEKVKGLDNPLRRRRESEDGNAAGGIVRHLEEAVGVVRRILPERTAAMMIDAVFK